MNKEKLIKDTFIAIACLIVVAILLEVSAMIQFAGGSHVDTTTEGFDFVWNTLTDLGRDPAPNGEPNLTSRILYRIAIFYMIFFGIVYNTIVWKYFTQKKSTKILSIIGSVLGITQSGLYIGVLYVESYPEHNYWIAAAAGTLIASVLVYLIAFFLNKELQTIHKWVYLSIFCLAVIYATIIFIGFLLYNAEAYVDPKRNLYYGIQRIGHTLFNWTLKIAFIVNSVVFYRYLKPIERF